ncbi:MAG: hypothetical protein K0S82_48 [Gaiellaceae bacterium]|jgi:hypothetical protein|nr:hypothetical protein [Gaiellaceae bacterium]
MPVYHFRLTDTETGEFRNVSVAADSKEEAEETVMRQEMKKVNFEEDAVTVKDLEERMKSGTLSGRDKARLLAHRQEKPYSIAKAKEG